MGKEKAPRGHHSLLFVALPVHVCSRLELGSNWQDLGRLSCLLAPGQENSSISYIFNFNCHVTTKKKLLIVFIKNVNKLLTSCGITDKLRRVLGPPLFFLSLIYINLVLSWNFNISYSKYIPREDINFNRPTVSAIETFIFLKIISEDLFCNFYQNISSSSFFACKLKDLYKVSKSDSCRVAKTRTRGKNIRRYSNASLSYLSRFFMRLLSLCSISDRHSRYSFRSLKMRNCFLYGDALKTSLAATCAVMRDISFTITFISCFVLEFIFIPLFYRKISLSSIYFNEKNALNKAFSRGETL